MIEPEIISNDKNIIIKKFNDLYYLIEFESSYDFSSNFLEIVDNKIIGSLLYELNKDIIKEYQKIDEYELLIFDTINSNLDNNYYLYFKYDIENINDVKILKIILKELDNNDYEKIELDYFNIYIIVENNYIKFKNELVYKNELSQFKIDMIILLLKKIFFRLNNYIK
jgi:hypothetical protein